MLSDAPGMGLPFELWLIVLSFLNRRPADLVACKRTCSSWVGPCNSMLRSLNYPTITTKPALETLIKQLLESPELQYYITSLDISPDSTSATDVLNFLPLTLPSKLKKVNSLTLKCASPTTINPTSWVLLSTFRVITTIDLVNVRLYYLADLTRVVCGLPQLRDFRAMDIDWAHTQTLSVPSRKQTKWKKQAHIEYLTLGVDHGDPHTVTDVLEWFSRDAFLKTLKILQFCLLMAFDYARVLSLLNVCKYPRLTFLDLEVIPTLFTSSFRG